MSYHVKSVFLSSLFRSHLILKQWDQTIDGEGICCDQVLPALLTEEMNQITKYQSWEFPYIPVPPAHFIDKEIIQKGSYNHKKDDRAKKRKEVSDSSL